DLLHGTPGVHPMPIVVLTSDKRFDFGAGGPETWGRGDLLTIVSQSFSTRNTSATRIAATRYRWSSHKWWSTQSGRSSRQFVAGAIRRGTTKRTPSYRQSPKARVSRLKKLLKRGSPNQVRQQQS